LIGVINEHVVEPVIAMDDRCGRVGRWHALRELVVQLIGARQGPAVRRIELFLPAAHLSGKESLRSAEVTQAAVARNPARGTGLIGVRDRVEAIGGTVSVQSPQRAGTRIDIVIPIVGSSGGPSRERPLAIDAGRGGDRKHKPRIRSLKASTTAVSSLIALAVQATALGAMHSSNGMSSPPDCSTDGRPQIAADR
jgi:hypothetical protein